MAVVVVVYICARVCEISARYVCIYDTCMCVAAAYACKHVLVRTAIAQLDFTHDALLHYQRLQIVLPLAANSNPTHTIYNVRQF
jgi:hypothetical protein